VDDPQVRQPDISRARALLDWEPEIDLRDGLRRTIDYAVGQLGGQRDRVIVDPE
jgi:nucleoside-diphosphate-sugar epimerase